MKKNVRKNIGTRLGITAALGLGLVVAVYSAQATIVANFDDGAGSTTVDQYPGIAGDGWTTAWTPTSDVTVQVLSGSPLNGGGNYLSVTPAIAATRGVRRSYTNYGDIDLTKTHAIQFDWRFSGTYANLNATGDRLFIGDGSTASGGEGSSTAFNVRAYGAAQGSANALEWAVYNGNQDDAGINSDPSRWVNTGMTLDHFVTYRFNITLHPETRTYDVAISNSTTMATVAVSGMGFNRSSFDVLGTLHFMANKSTGADNLTYGFDSVQIFVPVPEPSTLGLGGCSAVLLLLRKRLKNR